MPTTSQTYKSAGVDRDAAQQIKRRITSMASKTHGPQVLGGIGGFGALYELSGYRKPVLVSSTDGVGTKLKIAAAMNFYRGLGEDLVNACVNDVIVCGARPLFFLDYLAMGRLSGDVAVQVVEGMTRACEEVGCALIGGEIAELPGLYSGDDFDMAGFAVGAVEKSEMLDGSSIVEGDVLVGVPSNGLHTNGYSLVRHVLGLDDDRRRYNSTTPSWVKPWARRSWLRTPRTTGHWRRSSGWSKAWPISPAEGWSTTCRGCCLTASLPASTPAPGNYRPSSLSSRSRAM